jgi:hypothetical protein
MEQLVILPTNIDGLDFLDGWAAELEGTGDDTYRWTTAVTAKIKIPVISRVSATKPYLLSLDALPYLREQNTNYQDVGIYLDGLFLTNLRVAELGQVENQVFLPASNPSSLDSYSILSFVLPNSAVPAEHGNGSDLRQLGIGMRRLELKRLA